MLELMMQPQAVNGQLSLPYVVFVWGAKRSAVVRVVSVNIEENSFDGALNPARASVTLCLRVLDLAEIKNNTAARNVCINHQNVRSTLVDAYRQQTGQASAAGSVAPASGVATTATYVQNKIKIQ
jgi:hypothetical protein